MWRNIMRVDSIWMTAPGKTEIRTVEVNEPDHGQVQVEIKACGVCAWDSYLFRGVSLSQDFPFSFGHEGAGIVRSVGSGVEGYKAGDPVVVVGNGPLMAQLVNVPAYAIARINRQDPDFSQWIAEPVACVVNSLAVCPYKPGDVVALIGTGYMGLLNIQGMKSMPLGRLTCFDLSPERLRLAEKYGADDALLIGSQACEQRISEIIAAGGADVVVECSGSEAGYELANRLMKRSGILNLFGWHRGSRTFDGTKWHLGGYTVYNTAPPINRHFSDMIVPTVRMMQKGVFDQTDLITHIVPYNMSREVLETSISKEQGYIKGVITFA